MDSNKNRGSKRARVPSSASAKLVARRLLPSVDECVQSLAGMEAVGQFRRGYLALVVRRSIEEAREEIVQGAHLASDSRDRIRDEIIKRACREIDRDQPRIRNVVNATGVLIHTNLGRAPLAQSAIEAIKTAAGSPINLEYDLESGERGDRDELVEEEICALTGAEAATVVNNNAAAVLLALNSIAEGREVIVSRGELIEIGGSFRIPDVMAKSGARMREVGTTNRTHLADFERAIGPETGMLLKVHPSNYRIVGFTAEVNLRELATMAHARGIDLMEDLGSGALTDLTKFGGPKESIVAASVAAGAGIVTFSGDKLLGGPQAGIAVGKRGLIAKLKRNPLKRALRCDKLTLAALAATLRLYMRSANLDESIPVLRLMRRTVGDLELIAAKAAPLLVQRLEADFKVEKVESLAQIGSGAAPTEMLESRALRVTHPRYSADWIARHFRRARPPIIGRISDGAFLLDLRGVEDAASLASEFEPIDV
ncbi:MAG TPA: L-seryl-tRNA(Sec) selenium transferase [Candidatus Binataceae bacterium]